MILWMKYCEIAATFTAWIKYKQLLDVKIDYN